MTIVVEASREYIVCLGTGTIQNMAALIGALFKGRKPMIP